MGNCHAVDPVSATVEHPDGKVEKLYFSSSARQLMLQHQGHYVGLLPPPPPPSPDGSVVHVKRKLKLLPLDSMLNVGSCFKLVSFEDVLSELSDSGGQQGCSKAHQSTEKHVIQQVSLSPASTKGKHSARCGLGVDTRNVKEFLVAIRVNAASPTRRSMAT